jgi:hypothetical protein
MRKMHLYYIILHLALTQDVNDLMKIEGTCVFHGQNVYACIHIFTFCIYISRKTSRNIFAMSVCCGWLSIISFLCAIICLSLIFLASPLQSVEIITFGNVLGTQKQLIFNLHARAR